MGLADRLQQEQQTMEMLESLTSTHLAVELQLAKLTSAVEQLSRLLTASDEETSKQISRTERTLLESVTLLCANGSSHSPTNATVEEKLSEIEKTLKLLPAAIDGSAIPDALSSLQKATSELRQTTRWSAEQAKHHAQHVETIGAGAKIAIRNAHRAALNAVEDLGSRAAKLVVTQLDDATARAQRAIVAAERIEKGLGWASASRMALALLPVATVLLMFVMSVWTLVHSAQWVLQMDVDLWQRILADVALAGVVLGSCLGIWRAVVWLRDKLRWAK